MLRSFIFMLPLSLVLMGCGGLGLDSAAEVRATATLAPPATPRAADTPVAIVRLADTPRAADTPIAPAVAATAKPVVTPLAVLPSFTPQPVATRTPVPTATPINSEGARDKRDENVARCLHWALRNMEPVEFSRFEQLDPYVMTDLDRVLWGSVLVGRERVQSIESYYSRVNDEGIIEFESDHIQWCQDYWSAVLDARNAGSRNHETYRIKCVSTLIKSGWDFERDARSNFENYSDGEMSSVVVNQYVRLMNWMEMDGMALLHMDLKPHELVSRVWQRGSEDRYRSSNRVGGLPVESLANEDKEWWNIEDLWNSSHLRDCKGYYPQLFFGRWVPLDSFGIEDLVEPESVLQEFRKDLVEQRDGERRPKWFYRKQDRDILIRLDRK